MTLRVFDAQISWISGSQYRVTKPLRAVNAAFAARRAAPLYFTLEPKIAMLPRVFL